MNIKIGNGIGILKKKEQQTETIMTEEQDMTEEVEKIEENLIEEHLIEDKVKEDKK